MAPRRSQRSAARRNSLVSSSGSIDIESILEESAQNPVESGAGERENGGGGSSAQQKKGGKGKGKGRKGEAAQVEPISTENIHSPPRRQRRDPSQRRLPITPPQQNNTREFPQSSEVDEVPPPTQSVSPSLPTTKKRRSRSSEGPSTSLSPPKRSRAKKSTTSTTSTTATTTTSTATNSTANNTSTTTNSSASKSGGNNTSRRGKKSAKNAVETVESGTGNNNEGNSGSTSGSTGGNNASSGSVQKPKARRPTSSSKTQKAKTSKKSPNAGKNLVILTPSRELTSVDRTQDIREQLQMEMDQNSAEAMQQQGNNWGNSEEIIPSVTPAEVAGDSGGILSLAVPSDNVVHRVGEYIVFHNARAQTCLPNQMVPFILPHYTPTFTPYITLLVVKNSEVDFQPIILEVFYGVEESGSLKIQVSALTDHPINSFSLDLVLTTSVPTNTLLSPSSATSGDAINSESARYGQQQRVHGNNASMSGEGGSGGNSSTGGGGGRAGTSVVQLLPYQMVDGSCGYGVRVLADHVVKFLRENNRGDYSLSFGLIFRNHPFSPPPQPIQPLQNHPLSNYHNLLHAQIDPSRVNVIRAGAQDPSGRNIARQGSQVQFDLPGWSDAAGDAINMQERARAKKPHLRTPEIDMNLAGLLQPPASSSLPGDGEREKGKGKATAKPKAVRKKSTTTRKSTTSKTSASNNSSSNSASNSASNNSASNSASNNSASNSASNNSTGNSASNNSTGNSASNNSTGGAKAKGGRGANKRGSPRKKK